MLLWVGTLTNGGLLVFFLRHLTGKHDLDIYVFAGVVLFALLFTGISRKILGEVRIKPIHGRNDGAGGSAPRNL
ncbi:hypothetical protein [Fulvimarina sp. MAC3]|uniref:hypothetical protein n=1 Tax=Fulvimarina sp. MAC3 TaxID=3148887 RepID=UPI0031FC32AA